MTERGIGARLRRVDWRRIETELWEIGYALLPRLLTPRECRRLIALYADDRRFRQRVDMERHRFGAGEYRYFARPLPPPVRALRTGAYPPLAAIADRWMEALGAGERYPGNLRGLQAACRRAGQTRPTPLLLRYRAGGYNRLHQDLYGAIAFPLQITCLLSRPGVDFEGGEFLLVEQHPRAQSIGHAVTLERGDAVVFPNRARPVAGRRGHHRAPVRHGVSRLRSGERYALGIIFHDAA